MWALRLKGDSRKKSKKNSRRSQKKVTGYEMELKRSQFLTRLQIRHEFTSRHQRLSNALLYFTMCSSKSFNLIKNFIFFDYLCKLFKFFFYNFTLFFFFYSYSFLLFIYLFICYLCLYSSYDLLIHFFHYYSI